MQQLADSIGLQSSSLLPTKWREDKSDSLDRPGTRLERFQYFNLAEYPSQTHRRPERSIWS